MKFHSDLFGWDYVWRNFADTKEGEVITEETKQGDEEVVALSLPVDLAATSVLITPVVHYGKRMNSGTTAMTHFKANDDFSFLIQTEKWSDQVGKALGMQDIQVNDGLFDNRFLIQGNDPAKIQELFEDVQLRELILLQPPVQFGVLTTNFDPEWIIPKGHSVIVYRFDLLMDKLDQLETAYNIVTTTLRQLTAIGLVDNGAPVAVAPPNAVLSSDTGKKLRSPLLDR